MNINVAAWSDFRSGGRRRVRQVYTPEQFTAGLCQSAGCRRQKSEQANEGFTEFCGSSWGGAAESKEVEGRVHNLWSTSKKNARASASVNTRKSYMVVTSRFYLWRSQYPTSRQDHVVFGSNKCKIGHLTDVLTRDAFRFALQRS